MLPSFMTFVFIGMVWMPGHTGPLPDEFYAVPVDSVKKCFALAMTFEKANEDRASVSMVADEVAPRWTGDCKMYLSGGGKG